MKPNVVFLVIDSLRADKFYNSEKTSITPNIDNLMKNGAYFEQAISSSDATLLSWASLFTGKFPFKTGIKSDRYNKLDKSVTTYFEIFKNAGYSFYSYLPYVSSIIDLFPKFENNDAEYGYRKDLFDGLGDQIVDLFNSENMKNPNFFYIHTHDLHFPIVVPEEYSDSKFGKNNYEKNLSATDFWIGKFLEKIDLENTLFVLTADHGIFIPSIEQSAIGINFEVDGKKQLAVSSFSKNIPKFLNPIKSKIFYKLEEKKKKKKINIIEKLNLKPHQKRNMLWQRGDLDKVLFDDNVHVPLLICGLGIKSQTISQQVRLVDLMSTISELVGITETISDADGKSFVKLLKGEQIEELPAFMETSQLIQKKANESIGIRTSQYKYFRDSDDPTKRVHLYDLKNDPYEDNNIYQNSTSIVNSMEELISQIQQNTKSSSTKSPSDSSKIEDELKKLGYI